MSTVAVPVTTINVPAVPSAPKPNGFVNFLHHFGADAKKVLEWLASPANQQIVVAGEQAGAAVATAIEPALAGPIAGGLALVEKYTQEIFKAEAIGSAAVGADPASTDAQKALLVTAAVTPDAIAFAKANGLAIPTAANLTAANDAIVAFWQAWGVSGTQGK